MTIMSGKVITVYQVSGQFEGEIIKSFLEANGIATGIAQESAGITYGLTVGAMGTVDILVAEENVARARELLEEYQFGKLNIADTNDDDSDEDTEEE
jgi:hypothetical protein